MPDNGSELAAPSPAHSNAAPRRTHTYSRLTTVAAVLGFAIAGYALWRVEKLDDRLDALRASAHQLETDRAVLRTEINTLADRERRARRALELRIEELQETAKQVQELSAHVEDLRGRAQGPERAWSRAEALFLLELAQRRLTLDHDVDTAIAALEAADVRLAALREASFAAVRAQIARELQALRAVNRPDLSGVLARLDGAEEQAMHALVRGRMVERTVVDRSELPTGMLARAWELARRTATTLIVVRPASSREEMIVSAEEALLRRQHLQLMLFAARTAVERRDGASYRSTLASARQYLGEFFDLSDPVARSLLAEVQRLEPLNIAPPLPDVSGSLRALQRLTPARRGPE